MKTGISQESSILRLLVMRESADISCFNVYNTKLIEVNGWSVQVCVIGESHLIIARNRSFDIVLSEILACVPVNNKSVFNKRLCDLGSGNVELKFDRFCYEFKFQKIKFDDPVFKEKVNSVAGIDKDRISYNFATGEKDSLNDYFAPTTFISATITDKCIKFGSFHSYPNESLGIISETTIVPVN